MNITPINVRQFTLRGLGWRAH